MIAKKLIPPDATRLAARQGGVLTYSQAVRALGRTPLRRLLATGEWARVTPGIVATDRVVTSQARLWAGHLLGGPDSALGGRAALHLAGVGDAPGEVDVWVPGTVKRRDRGSWRFHRDGLGRLEHTMGSLPRIRAEEALIDVGQDLDVEGRVDILSEAARKGTVHLGEVLRRLDQRPSLSNRSLLRDVTVDLEGIESTL